MNMDRMPIRITLLPLWLLAVVLILALAACANTGTTDVPSATVTSTPAPTSATQKIPTTAVKVASNPGTSKPTLALTAIRMLDQHNGWALTASSILKTADGGAHWKDVTPANAGLNQYAKGQFMNGQYAWIAVGPYQMQEGAGIVVLRTADGGASWQRSKINDPLVSIVDVPHFLNAQQGWLEISAMPDAGHSESDIWHSMDGGQTWSKIATNVENNGLYLGHVTGISFNDAQNGIAAGDRGTGGDNSVPSLALTHNGGQSWQVLLLPHVLGGYMGLANQSQPPVFFGNVVFLPVFVSTHTGNLLILYRSNDGGQNWVQTSPAHIFARNTYVLDVNHAWATDSQSGKLYRTRDGGGNWSAVSNSAYKLGALSFTDANTGWGIAGQQLLHTSDGGASWQPIHYAIA
ncbi:hypothetical protein KDW_60540 [Dictyobacter vulcani]|uniref:Photosynthesis system II assembly factor Ycf48/Hcf136-like domain-containing protein n=1 Tax=Dictyobacter vulcani TaxID=2607529 RepID=A0A5J4KXU7_9CHLR|nr:hypothetical protein [Dictyobacter vulcani]GER91892.1 hypothetical protein KDW_60540 [Dictyobacter vulcani]